MSENDLQEEPVKQSSLTSRILSFAKRGAVAGILIAFLSAFFTYMLTSVRTSIDRMVNFQYEIFNESDAIVGDVKTNMAQFRALCSAHKGKLDIGTVQVFAKRHGELQAAYFKSIHNVGFYYHNDPNVRKQANLFNQYLVGVKFNCKQIPSDEEMDRTHDILFNVFAEYLNKGFVFNSLRP